jgi:hypothetical protein
MLIFGQRGQRQIAVGDRMMAEKKTLAAAAALALLGAVLSSIHDARAAGALDRCRTG